MPTVSRLFTLEITRIVSWVDNINNRRRLSYTAIAIAGLYPYFVTFNDSVDIITLQIF